MPKTSVNEHGHTDATEDEIGPGSNADFWATIDSKPIPGAM